MKKSFFSLLMAIVLPMTAWCNDGDTFTAETQEGAVVTYRVLSESAKTCQIGGVFTPRYTMYVAISDYTGDVTIPTEVNGYTVTLVKHNAFGGSSNTWAGVPPTPSNLHIDHLQLPETIITIEEGAFSEGDVKHVTLSGNFNTTGAIFGYCSTLESIDLPEGITSLPNKLFAYCQSPVVESFVIPATVTKIGDYCFQGSNMKSIVVPATVQQVGNGAFNDCDQMTTAIVESSATMLGNGAFSGCDLLTEFTFPEGTTYVPESILNDAKLLEKVVLPPTVLTIGSGAFRDCRSLSDVALPEGLTDIGASAFRNSGLTSVELPSTLTAIRFWAFYDCKLEKVISRITVPFGIESATFSDDTYETAPLYVPEDTEQLYKDTFAWSQFYGIYPSIITGLSESRTQVQKDVRYTTDGRKATDNQRGLQVVKRADGSVIKTFVK